MAGVVKGASVGHVVDARMILLLAAAFAQQTFFYGYNDCCDFKRDLANPRKPPRSRRGYSILKAATAGTFLISSALVAMLDRPLSIFGLIIQVLGIAYSAPVILLRCRIPLAQCIHFLVGSSYFIGGLMASGARASDSDYLLAAFFGLIYMSGGLNNEVIDLACDREAGIQSLGMLLGARRALRLVIAIQIVAILALAGACTQGSARFVPPLGLAAYLWMLRKNGPPPSPKLDELEGFRRKYRGVFAAITAALLFSWAA